MEMIYPLLIGTSLLIIILLILVVIALSKPSSYEKRRRSVREDLNKIKTSISDGDYF